ncbi:MAG: Lhr family ATP-dependent helicase, partial [Terriglobales bacterium]
ASGARQCLAVDTPAPSAFSHEILNANPYAYLDDAPLEERRARAVEMRRALPDTTMRDLGRLDPAAIEQAREEAWPDVRDADEMADALFTLVAMPEDFVMPGGRPVESCWGCHLRTLASERRAARALHEGVARWVSAEKAKTFLEIFPDSQFEGEMAALDGPAPTREDAVWETVRGWTACLGPVTPGALAQALGIARADVTQALLRLEASGVVLRGHFTGADGDEEWCERRLLARIHRRTLGTLRAQIAPVSPSQFFSWLARWQHVAPGTQVRGERGLLETIRQLEGFEIAANSWETQIFARRVADYDSEMLDRLCLTGAVGWGRISPHSSMFEAGGNGNESKRAPRRVAPSSVAPIAFFIREGADWMMPRGAAAADAAAGLSHAGREALEFLRQRGASFFADIVRSTGRLKSEVEAALWELVTAGLVTADGFDNLRALIDPKRRAGQGRGKISRPRHSSGRWSLLFDGAPQDRTRAAEAICNILLRRYGVIFRELLARESFDFKWR